MSKPDETELKKAADKVKEAVDDFLALYQNYLTKTRQKDLKKDYVGLSSQLNLVANLWKYPTRNSIWPVPDIETTPINPPTNSERNLLETNGWEEILDDFESGRRGGNVYYGRKKDTPNSKMVVICYSNQGVAFRDPNTLRWGTFSNKDQFKDLVIDGWKVF